jgi:hypothetical protein
MADVAFQVVQPVRNDLAIGRAGEVVIEGAIGPGGIRPPGAEELAQKLFLFGVHADDWMGRVEVLLLQASDVLKCIAFYRSWRSHGR